MILFNKNLVHAASRHREQPFTGGQFAKNRLRVLVRKNSAYKGGIAMGEIIISIVIGGCMFICGLLLRVCLGKEAKKHAINK
jgi:hypothetical protein